MKELDFYNRDIVKAIKDNQIGVFESVIEKLSINKEEEGVVILEDHIIGNDGSNICNLSQASKVDLAKQNIGDYGAESFVKFLSNDGLSSAIYFVASEQLDIETSQLTRRTFRRLCGLFYDDSKSNGTKYKQKTLTLGSSCHLDHFPPHNVKGNIEEYRNVEGTGNNFDVYHYAVNGLDFTIVCSFSSPKKA